MGNIDVKKIPPTLGRISAKLNKGKLTEVFLYR